jgi:hypothetical protein
LAKTGWPKREEPAEAMLRTGSYAIASKLYSLESKVPGGWGADESGAHLSEPRVDICRLAFLCGGRWAAKRQNYDLPVP